LTTTHEDKNKKKAGYGDKWLRSMLNTLEVGCTQHDLENEEAPEEAAEREEPTAAMLELANLLYIRITSFSDGEHMVKSDLVAAHHGDFMIFNTIDIDSNNVITLEEWMAWLHETHMEKRKKRRGSGDKWLTNLLHTLEVGCTQYELEIQNETEDEAALRDGPQEVMLEMAGLIFKRMEAYSADPGLARIDFGAANHGDFSWFDSMDNNRNQTVVLEEWMSYFHETHCQKRKKEQGSGDKWMLETLVILETACAQHDLKTKEETPEEAAEREGPTVPMMEMASLVFRKLASLSAADGMIKADFLAAKGEAKLWGFMDKDKDGRVELDEWLNYIHETHTAKRKEDKGSGDHWLSTFLDELNKGTMAEDEDKHEAILDYGTTPNIEISMGKSAWYKVCGAGKQGAKLRKGAALSSEPCGEAPFGTDVRVDAVQELPDGRFRARLVEPHTGWCSASVMTCKSGQCGMCYTCDGTGFLPSVRAGRNYRNETKLGIGYRVGIGLSQLMDEVALASEQKWLPGDKASQEEASQVYTAMSATGLMQKHTVVEAHGGSFMLFDKLNADDNGGVSQHAWHSFLVRTQKQRGSSFVKALLAAIMEPNPAPAPLAVVEEPAKSPPQDDDALEHFVALYDESQDAIGHLQNELETLRHNFEMKATVENLEGERDRLRAEIKNERVALCCRIEELETENGALQTQLNASKEGTQALLVKAREMAQVDFEAERKRLELENGVRIAIAAKVAEGLHQLVRPPPPNLNCVMLEADPLGDWGLSTRMQQDAEEANRQERKVKLNRLSAIVENRVENRGGSVANVARETGEVVWRKTKGVLSTQFAEAAARAKHIEAENDAVRPVDVSAEMAYVKAMPDGVDKVDAMKKLAKQEVHGLIQADLLSPASKHRAQNHVTPAPESPVSFIRSPSTPRKAFSEMEVITAYGSIMHTPCTSTAQSPRSTTPRSFINSAMNSALTPQSTLVRRNIERQEEHRGESINKRAMHDSDLSPAGDQNSAVAFVAFDSVHMIEDYVSSIDPGDDWASPLLRRRL